MSSFSDKRRDIKRAYRKKAFQTNMSVVKDTVDNVPAPEHTYSTPSHSQTSPFRKGIDPHTYMTDVRPAVEHLDFARAVDTARFPWHLYPKGDSANVISRAKYDFTGDTIADDEYMDVLVLNVADVSGSNTTTPTTIPGPVPSPANLTKRFADGSQTGTGNPSFPNQGGNTITGVSGSEIYKIKSFGHSEVSQSNQSIGGGFTTTDPLRYQIWVDGVLFMEWQNFQWSPVTPLQSQWHFTQPLTVTEQVVFRIINQTGQTLDTGDMEICFNGWSEQLSGYVDVAYQQLENN
jgi:hypothetical protein